MFPINLCNSSPTYFSREREEQIELIHPSNNDISKFFPTYLIHIQVTSSTFLQNISKDILDYTSSHPRTQQSTCKSYSGSSFEENVRDQVMALIGLTCSCIWWTVDVGSFQLMWTPTCCLRWNGLSWPYWYVPWGAFLWWAALWGRLPCLRKCPPLFCLLPYSAPPSNSALC
jgi:hypothetical protein